MCAPPSRGRMSEPDPDPPERRTRALRLAAALCLAQALAALALDPAQLERAGSLEAVPGRDDARLAASLTALAAVLLLARPRRATALVLLALGALTLLASTPSGPAPMHVLQAASLAAALLFVAFHGARHHARATRLLLAGLPLLAAEGAFACVARSHAVGYTLAARLWFARHWNPPGNAAGFRDVEHPPEDPRPALYVLGDSLVAGVGIADVRQRFSERLAAGLGDGWVVHNLGYNGADTARELELLRAYPGRPAVIVLSWYPNDIAGAGARLLGQTPRYRPHRDLGRLAWLVSRSYLLDYLYWSTPRADLGAEARFLASAYDAARVVAEHRRELAELVREARARSPRVVAVVFPDLLDLAPEPSPADLALETFAALGVPAVDVRTLVAELPPAQRVVNANDAHPSALVHARVATALFELLQPRAAR